jgi:dTDP-4-dehydrorhamnose 3,5-epimerase
VISEFADFTYKCTEYYYPESEVSIKHNDSQLNIQWPYVEGVETLLSPKDLNGLSFADAPMLDLK